MATAKKKSKASKASKSTAKAPKKLAKKPAQKATKASAKKAAPKKAVVKKVSPKKAAAKNAPVKKAAPAKASTKVSAKKAPAKKSSVAKKAAPQKATAIKTTPVNAYLKKSTEKAVDLSGFVTPLDDRVMIQLAGAEKMTAGGLYIPDTVADVSGNLQGFVVSVGRGHRNKKGHVRPMDLRVGDKVLVSEHTGSKIKIQDQDVLIVREGDVLGVVS